MYPYFVLVGGSVSRSIDVRNMLVTTPQEPGPPYAATFISLCDNGPGKYVFFQNLGACFNTSYSIAFSNNCVLVLLVPAAEEDAVEYMRGELAKQELVLREYPFIIAILDPADGVRFDEVALRNFAAVHGAEIVEVNGKDDVDDLRRAMLRFLVPQLRLKMDCHPACKRELGESFLQPCKVRVEGHEMFLILGSCRKNTLQNAPFLVFDVNSPESVEYLEKLPPMEGRCMTTVIAFGKARDTEISRGVKRRGMALAQRLHALYIEVDNEKRNEDIFFEITLTRLLRHFAVHMRHWPMRPK